MNAGPSDLRDMPKQPSKRTLQQALRQMFGTSSGLVFESAGNPIEWTLYAQILTRIRACRFVVCTTSDNRRRAVREHKDIMQAIQTPMNDVYPACSAARRLGDSRHHDTREPWSA